MLVKNLLLEGILGKIHLANGAVKRAAKERSGFADPLQPLVLPMDHFTVHQVACNTP